MKISITDLNKFVLGFLEKLELNDDEAGYIAKNIINAELAGRKTHGIIRLNQIKAFITNGDVRPNYKELDILSETNTSIHIDGHNQLGFSVISRALEKGFDKVKQLGMVMIGIKDVQITGYIGSYALQATNNQLIYLGFHNSPGSLVPYGSIKDLWGTNPMTIGVPTKHIPVILDMASSYISFGALMQAKAAGKQIPHGVAIDNHGNPTTDPAAAIEGGLLPFAGHKGSGLAFIVELLAGALTGARVGGAVEGGWGSFSILIDPTIFRPFSDFSADVEKAISELKAAPKAHGFSEIYFAGEQSYMTRLKNLESGFVDVDETAYKSLEI